MPRYAVLAGAGAVLVLAAAHGVTAQDRLLRGRMVARGNGAAVRNAAVRPVGGGAGACTSDDGSFAVVVPTGTAWLELAVPGWVGRVPVSEDADEVTLEMDPRVVPIEPLIVEVPRSGAHEGAVHAEIRPGKEQAAAADMRSLLQGRVPGAMVVTSSGTIGSGFRLILRGLSSITGSNEPLVVVDGVIMGSRGPDIFGSTITASPGGLQELNPDDIDRIEILKGPAASTLYGSMGMHGVVLVTTKHGRRAVDAPDEDAGKPRCPGWPK